MNRSTLLLMATVLVTSVPDFTSALHAEEAADVLKGVIDPFDAGDERRRFLAAAGVDGELDEQEFKANQTASDPFIRKFDAWLQLKAFDANRNSSLDWFEVEGYRQAVRDAMLKTYDKNQDSRLTEGERDVAAKELAGGRLPRLTLPGGGGIVRGNSDWDTNGDGKMDDEERAAYIKVQQERSAQWQADYLKKWDADGDGKVSAAESEAARKAQWDEWKAKYPEQAARWEQQQAEYKKQQEEYTRKWDADGDGQLSAEEHKAASEERVREWREKNPEQAALWDKQQAQYKKQQEEYTRKWDSDGDGKLSREEYQAAHKSQQDEYLRKWDADGDGKVSADEHKAASDFAMRDWREKNPEAAARWDKQQEEWKKQQEERVRKYDADGDGKLSPDEWREVWKNEKPQGGIYQGGGGFGGGVIIPQQ